jgi:subtilase family serine protease
MLTASDLKNETISALGKFPRQFKGQSEDWEYYWGVSDGTSMATPTAAGIVAL